MHEEKEKTLAAEEESLYKERIFWGEKRKNIWTLEILNWAPHFHPQSEGKTLVKYTLRKILGHWSKINPIISVPITDLIKYLKKLNKFLLNKVLTTEFTLVRESIV